MSKSRDDVVEEKLDKVITLLQHLVALELARMGVPKQAIAKRIRVATGTVVSMLKGVKKDA